MATYSILGIDVGGTAKIMEFFGNSRGELSFAKAYPEDDPIPSVVTPENVPSEQFMGLLEREIEETGLKLNDCLVGYSICGPIVGNICLRLVNRGIETFTIKAHAVLNDAMAATIASRLTGVAKGHEGALTLLTLGTGIGVGSFHWVGKDTLVMNDCEGSHMAVRGCNFLCGCGRVGCFEASANELAILIYADQYWPDSTIDRNDVGRSLEAALLTMPSDRPKGLSRVMEVWHKALAVGIANLYVVQNMGGNEIQPPALFVLGGGLCGLVDEERVERLVLDEFNGNPVVGLRFNVRREAKIGNRAGAIGAAAMALANTLGCDITEIQFKGIA